MHEREKFTRFVHRCEILFSMRLKCARSIDVSSELRCIDWISKTCISSELASVVAAAVFSMRMRAVECYHAFREVDACLVSVDRTRSNLLSTNIQLITVNIFAPRVTKDY